tara:strand:+ start:39 stop:332 length:294 start_codon:yes stop_codon:yes gene_type:complete
MKSFLKSMVINAVKPKVNTTTLGTAKSKLAKAIQKEKASSAKLGQTKFEAANPKFRGKKFTFAPVGKAVKESDRKKQIIKDNSKVISKMFKKVLEKK